MELIIYKPQGEQILETIEFNYPELKEELTRRLEKYRGLVYSETEIAAAKKDRASLNKFKAALEERRREVKAQCLKPYEDFEQKIKDLVSMLDEAAGEIDAQVKAFEQQKKEGKRQEIDAFYRYTVPDELQKLMPLEQIWNERWLNVTFSLSAIQDEILQTTDRVVNELKVIDELDSPYKDQIKLEYLRSLDLGRALQEGKRREAEAQRLKEYEERQKARERPPESPREEKGPAGTQEAMPIPNEAQGAQETAGSREWIAFRLWVTPEQKAQLKQWILENQIPCKKV